MTHRIKLKLSHDKSDPSDILHMGVGNGKLGVPSWGFAEIEHSVVVLLLKSVLLFKACCGIALSEVAVAY